MKNMFTNCTSFNQDLSMWNTSSVTNMIEMFSGCSSMKDIDLSSWSVNNVSEYDNFFNGVDDSNTSPQFESGDE